MTDLSAEQIAKVKLKVNASTDRYEFCHALATDRDRKLVVMTVFTKDGDPHVAVAKTDKTPNWLTNDAQFDEVVDDVVKKLARPGWG